MLEVRTTDVFERWFDGLRDRRARARIQARIDRLRMGHFGDVAPVGGGVSEMRIFHGPGYRLYLVQRGPVLVILLCGGDKGSQSADIARASKLAIELEE